MNKITPLFVIACILLILSVFSHLFSLLNIGILILISVFGAALFLRNRLHWGAVLAITLCSLGEITFYRLSMIRFHPYQVLLVTSLLALLMQFITRRQKPSFPYIYSLGTFLVIIILGALLTAKYPLVSIKQLLLLTLYISFFFLIVNSCSSEQMELIYKAILFSAFIVYLYGLYQMIETRFLGLYGVKYYFLRPKSFFVEGNEFGQYLVFIFGFLLVGLISDVKIVNRKFLWIMLLMHISLTILNMSRGSWIGMLVIVIIVMLRLQENYNLRKIAICSISIVVISLVTLQTVDRFIPSQYLPIRQAILQRSKGLFTKGDLTVLSRYSQSLTAASVTMKNPLLGIGYGNIFTIMPSGIFSLHSKIPGIPIIGNATSSNFLLDIAVETGIIGFIIFLLFIIRVIMKSFRGGMQIKEPKTKAIYFGVLYSSLGMMVNGLTYAVHMLSFFWISLGLLSILDIHKEK